MAVLRPRYHQILRPRRHLAKLANRLRRHADLSIHFHLRGVWQTAKRYLERGNVSWLVSHLGFSLCLQPTKLYHLPGYLEVLFQRSTHDLARDRRKQEFSIAVLHPWHVLPPPRRCFRRCAFEDADGLVGVDGIAGFPLKPPAQ